MEKQRINNTIFMVFDEIEMNPTFVGTNELKHYINTDAIVSMSSVKKDKVSQSINRFTTYPATIITTADGEIHEVYKSTLEVVKGLSSHNIVLV